MRCIQWKILLLWNVPKAFDVVIDFKTSHVAKLRYIKDFAISWLHIVMKLNMILSTAALHQMRPVIWATLTSWWFEIDMIPHWIIKSANSTKGLILLAFELVVIRIIITSQYWIVISSFGFPSFLDSNANSICISFCSLSVQFINFLVKHNETENI